MSVGLTRTEMFLLRGIKQLGLMSRSSRASTRESLWYTQFLPAWLTSRGANHIAVTEQPDTVAEQLRRDGDIETNTGPAYPPRSTRLRPCTRADQSSINLDGGDVNAGVRSVAGNSGSQPESRECKGCRKNISKGSKHPLKCKECNALYHDKHSGETRFAITKIRKYNKAWTCPYCRLGAEPLDNEQKMAQQAYRSLVNAWQHDVYDVKSGAEMTTSHAQRARATSTSRNHAAV